MLKKYTTKWASKLSEIEKMIYLSMEDVLNGLFVAEAD